MLPRKYRVTGSGVRAGGSHRREFTGQQQVTPSDDDFLNDSFAVCEKCAGKEDGTKEYSSNHPKPIIESLNRLLFGLTV
ncbi:hypothetical protein PoB_000877100 [Plakobranchus ocellatus]|uniref:Uncharacterized protein n=1 Tax=Plakobranchus ocellatus TaxID=259542 RepID=A0AAV3Y4V9_9GAST|nr:hypothetical protein PoB_000877100 [Plakobranchus ocellatus]